MIGNWNIIGHDWAVAALQRDIHDDRLRHAYLIAGPAGIGKRTLAIAFIRTLLCEKQTGCNECRPCKVVASGNHPDLITVAPVVSGKTIKTEKITVDRIRDLIKTLWLKPAEASRRVALVTNFETANEEASNAFLKTLEEPPGDAILVLTADNAESLLPTIRSRCETITLRPLPAAIIRDALRQYWEATSERAELLAHLSGGRLGWAVNALADDGQMLERRGQQLDELQTLLSSSRAARFAYAEGLAKDRDALKETLDLWLGWWRDVMVMASNAEAAPLNRDRLPALHRAADSVGLDSAAQAVESIQRTLNLLPRNINARLALEVLMLDLPRL
ncbi:MAG TPA: DNA polymerase III subunit delta' [Anaerolineales bacterium]|nr:DNA polymerase III subunit delta' [Anaerolineales bacterium]